MYLYAYELSTFSQMIQNDSIDQHSLQNKKKAGNWFKEQHKAEMTSEYVLPSNPKITDDLKNQTKTKGDRKKCNLRIL